MINKIRYFNLMDALTTPPSPIHTARSSANFILSDTLHLMKAKELAESSYFSLIFKPTDLHKCLQTYLRYVLHLFVHLFYRSKESAQKLDWQCVYLCVLSIDESETSYLSFADFLNVSTIFQKPHRRVILIYISTFIITIYGTFLPHKVAIIYLYYKNKDKKGKLLSKNKMNSPYERHK